MVVRKQAPTPTKRAAPNCPNPRQMLNVREPNPNMVVKVVSRMALPVLEKTTWILPLPSAGMREFGNLLRMTLILSGA